jgi:hypothetical protein
MPFVPLFILLMIFLALAVVLGTILFARRLRQGMTRFVRQASLPRPIARSLRESRYYGGLIIQTVAQYPPGPMHDRLDLTIRPVNRWLKKLDRLEQGIIKLYSQRNLGRELRQVDFEIDSLRRRLLSARGEEAACLRDLKESKEKHRAVLQELHQFQRQAELKIRKTASDLAATHAEMLLIIAKGDFNENRLHRLDESLQEQMSGMKDILAAMDELGYGMSGV